MILTLALVAALAALGAAVYYALADGQLLTIETLVDVAVLATAALTASGASWGIYALAFSF